MSVPPNAVLAAALTAGNKKARSARAVRASDGRNTLRDLRLQSRVIQGSSPLHRYFHGKWARIVPMEKRMSENLQARLIWSVMGTHEDHDERSACCARAFAAYGREGNRPKGTDGKSRVFVPREVLQEMGRLGFLGLRYRKSSARGAGCEGDGAAPEELGRSTFGGFAITVPRAHGHGVAASRERGDAGADQTVSAKK